MDGKLTLGQIKRGTVVICETLGWEVVKNKKGIYFYYSDDFKLIPFDSTLNIEACQFHSNWNWIMYVMEKLLHFNMEDKEIVDSYFKTSATLQTLEKNLVFANIVLHCLNLRKK